MTEKVQIRGRDIWIVIEPHATQTVAAVTKEYFTASYHAVDPATDPAGILFLDQFKQPIRFDSPVEALEYSNEKLLE